MTQMDNFSDLLIGFSQVRNQIEGIVEHFKMV